MSVRVVSYPLTKDKTSFEVMRYVGSTGPESLHEATKVPVYKSRQEACRAIGEDIGKYTVDAEMLYIIRGV